MNPTLRELSTIATRPDHDIDLAYSALVINRLFDQGLQIEPSVRRLEDLARVVRGRISGASSDVEIRAEMEKVLFGDEGFRGNSEDYQDPRNSYLSQVLTRRKGIPITLSVVYLDVARRLGLDAEGIGFPGHFLVRVRDTGGDHILDVFSGGRPLSDSDLDGLLNRALGENAPSVKSHRGLLRPATHLEILVRMLRNLKSVFFASQDSASALLALEGILSLAPNQPEDLCDRGLLYRDLGYFPAALDDLRRFLELTRDARAAAAVTEIVGELETRQLSIH